MEDLANAPVYEIKQEIADRYFGFRAYIETESGIYIKALQRAKSASPAEIQLDLQRMQCLLITEELFRSFAVYAGLPSEFAWKRIAPKSSLQWQTLFRDLRIVPPPPVTSSLVSLSPMPPLKTAKNELAETLKRVFVLSTEINIKHFPF